jgi:carboxyl-terminal processing protease
MGGVNFGTPPSADLTVTFTARMTPPPVGPTAPVTLLNGNVAYAKIQGFSVDMVNSALQGIADLRSNTELRGVIFDLRGNHGGAPAAVAKLLGAFAHDTVTSYWCDVKDHCTRNYTNDSVALLNLPMVALVDRACASACDAFSGAVKDLHLGTLVGTRTSGIVLGAADIFGLDDGTSMSLPRYHQIEANREIINTIGVAPDYFAPLTAEDLSWGRDPGLDKALMLLP